MRKTAADWPHHGSGMRQFASRTAERRANIARLCAFAALFFVAAIASAQQPQTDHPAPNGAAQPPTTTPPSPAIGAPPRRPPLSPVRAVDTPPRPDAPRKAKAYAVFEAHCARCHQAGKTTSPLPSGGLGDILDLDRLAADPALVRPSIPDASRIFDVLVTRHAPLEVYRTGLEGGEPRPEEIQSVREWIGDLPRTDTTCAARKPVLRDRLADAVREAQRIEREGASDLRFISIAHLYNGCASTAELKVYRQALAKALNSVSRANEPVKLSAVDPDELVFAIRLADFGWGKADWELIARAAPPTPALAWPEDIKTRAVTKLPIAPGDWFAAIASEPPIYYALLGVPERLADLGRANGVDIDQNLRLGVARRAALRESAITRGNRLAERHAGTNGGFWLMYDFATGEGEQDVFHRPLGPQRSALVASPFKPDMVRAAFVRPNGFFGYALFNSAGNRLDRALPGIERPFMGAEALRPEPGTKPGANCFACHIDGVIGARDEFRAFATAEPSPLTAPVRDEALRLFPAESEMTLLVEGDVERFRKSLKAAGVDADALLGGDEPVTALAERYRRSVGFEAALSETGLLKDAFVLQLAEATGAAAPLARRLQQGVLPRADLNRLYALLKGADEPVKRESGGFLRDVETEIGLSLRLDPPRPIAGDLVTLTAEANADCYLTVISVDAKSKATVLFPNEFEPDPLLRAGESASVPNPEAPYQLRFKALGPETILARCSTSPKPPMGIEHDFERQKFTPLGNWEVFIQDTLITDAEMRNSPEKAQRAEAARADARRRSGTTGTRQEQRADTMPGQLLRDGRAVLVIGVN